MKKLIVSIIILFGLGYIILDKFILWMHEYELSMEGM